MLSDDPFQITVARQLEQTFTFALHMIDVEQMRKIRRHQLTQFALTLDQPQLAPVSTVQPQQVESAKSCRSTPEQQIVKLGTAVFIQADDLTIEDGFPSRDCSS